MKKYIAFKSFLLAHKAIKKATAICSAKNNNLTLYGIGYKKTHNYAYLEFYERFYYMVFLIFKNVFLKLNK